MMSTVLGLCSRTCPTGRNHFNIYPLMVFTLFLILWTNLMHQENLAKVANPQVIEEWGAAVEQVTILSASCIKLKGEGRPTMWWICWTNTRRAPIRIQEDGGKYIVPEGFGLRGRLYCDELYHDRRTTKHGTVEPQKIKLGQRPLGRCTRPLLGSFWSGKWPYVIN